MCLNDCPANMTLQNTTNTELYTCRSTNNSTTNSSTTEEKFVLLCWSMCPSGTYNASRQCITCDKECATCSNKGTLTIDCTCKNYEQNGHCVPKCDDEYYIEDEQKCIKCNERCTTCTGAGTDTNVCTCKFKFNNTCVELCPNGTTLQNHICVAMNNKHDDVVDNTIIIAAAAGGGGGGILIIIIIIVVVCCCRRKKQSKSRMSVLIDVCALFVYFMLQLLLSS